MSHLPLLRQRLKKLRDNPGSIVHFLKKRVWYSLVADTRAKKLSGIQHLSASDTLNYVMDNNVSLIRFGDGEFDVICGVGVYFNDWYQQYDATLKKRLEEIMASSDPRILICFNLQYILKTKEEFIKESIPNEYRFWIVSKSLIGKFIQKNNLYGSGHCFYPKINTEIDFTKIKAFFANRNIVIITTNTERFKHISLGKSTHFIEAPKSNSWQEYDTIKLHIDDYIKTSKNSKDSTLFLVSAGSAAKVIVYDLALRGYTAWDTGQFFDFAHKEIEKLGQPH